LLARLEIGAEGPVLGAGTKGLLADQFGLTAAVLAESVFPDSTHVKPMPGSII
jgi:uncharacterized protein (DUF1501 family)